MDLESGVIVVSRYVGQARITDAHDLERRLEEALARSKEGELVGLLLLMVDLFPKRKLAEEEYDEIFYQLSRSARMVDLVAQVRPELFAILEPELTTIHEARATSERVFQSLSRMGLNADIRLGLAFAFGQVESSAELFAAATEELEVARDEGSWSAREPLKSVLEVQLG